MLSRLSRSISPASKLVPSCVARWASTYTSCTQGTLGKDFDYQCQVKENIGGKEEIISPWHDIDYMATPYIKQKPAVVNFVMEIPRGGSEERFLLSENILMCRQSAKTEIATKVSFNPIKQDVKKGALRFYGAPSMINYGAVPQTWENPHKKELTDVGVFVGDNDPLDIMDFSYIPHLVGDVYPVKVYGAIALIDEGEMDWKLLGVNAEDPIANQLRDYCDFFEHFHHDLDKMRHWLRTYKMVDGKGENMLAYNGIPFQEADAWEMVIEPNHQEWEKLIRGEEERGELCLDRMRK